MSKQSFSIFMLLITCLMLIDPLHGIYEKKIPYEFSEQSTLEELSKQLSIPIGKLKEHLGLEQVSENTSTLSELQIDREMVESARQEFRHKIWGFSWNIVLVGMVVIFCSLSLTGLLIGLLSRVVKYSEKPETLEKMSDMKGIKKESVKVKIEDIKSRDAGYNAVIAAITALHFHLQEAEELSRMTLSWKREPVSVWKTSGKFDMPNRVLREKK